VTPGEREATAGRHQFTVESDEAGTRLDVFLAQHLPGLSRSQIQHLIRKGLVSAGGRPAKSGLAVTAGLAVEANVPSPAPGTPIPEPLPIEILYDDDDLVVVNKAVGMVVHPAAGHAGGTLVNALLHHVKGLSGIGGTERPGIVHRLDRGTSGVMVVAKNDRAHRNLAAQFHDRTVTKEYIALVWGQPPAGLAIRTPIGRDPHHRQKMSSRARRGRAALTTIVSVAPLGGVSLLRLQIGTGRTHQIRVHLSEAGFPVVGDALYGGVRRRLPAGLAALAALERPFLHAARLEFAHPADGRPMRFEAPLDAELSRVVETLSRARKVDGGDTDATQD
jgi:23S rRNA pseudouridine1911/1915/1917 synthase